MLHLRSLLFHVAILLTALDTATAAQLVWQGTTEIATGRGEKGPWQQNDSCYDYVDDPAVIIDQRSNVAVAWVAQESKDVFFRHVSADGSLQHREPVNVSRSADTFSWLPRIVRAPDAPQTIYILWQEIIFSGGSHGGEMLFSRSDDNGATFSPPLNISSSIGGDGKGRINRDVWHNGSFDLVAGPDGALYVAWTEYDGPLWFSRSIDSGKKFSRPQRIAGGGNAKPARAPSLALGKNGTLYLAWTTGEDDSADIHIAKSVDGGAHFQAPQIVAPDKGYADAPRLAVAPDGVLHLTYAQSRGGPFDKYRIRYTRSVDGRSFDAPREISAPLPASIESAAFPALSIDSDSRLYILYELFPDRRQRPHGLGMSMSADGGKNFTPSLFVPHSRDPSGGTNGSHQGLLMTKLAVNDTGSIAVVNSGLKQGEQSRVWLMRGEMKPAATGR